MAHVAGAAFRGAGVPLSTLGYPFVWVKGVLNGYSSTHAGAGAGAGAAVRRTGGAGDADVPR